MDADKISDKRVRNITLLVVALGSFLIPFMGSSLNIVLPIIQKELTVNLIQLSWIPTVFVLANAAFVLPFGHLSDIIGRKKIFTYGVVIYTIASFLAGMSSSGTYLIIFSFIQGLGCSMIFATGVALLSSVCPSYRRGEALGIYVTAVYIGLFLGPILGGFLAQNFGWRSIYYFNVPFGLFLFGMIIWLLKGEWMGHAGEKFDIRGSIIYTLSIIALLYGITSLNSTIGVVAILAGITGLIFFLLNEKLSLAPILKLGILKNKITSLSALGLLLINIATTAMWALLSLYFQDLLGLGPQVTALILSVQPLMVALLSTPIGRLADNVEYRVFAVFGMIVTTMGLLTLSTINTSTSLMLPIFGLIMVGVGIGLFSSPTTNKFIGSIGGSDYGMASASLSTMVYMGQTLSLGIMLFIFATYIGNVQIHPSNYNMFLLSLKTAFTIFAVISGLGLAVSIFVKENNNK